MKILLDTNILVRAAQPNSADWSSINSSLLKLVSLGSRLCVVPQNVFELWVVATRPAAVNGFGMDVNSATVIVEDLLTRFQLMRDERSVFGFWFDLVQHHSVTGKNAHDARLVAAMKRHSISNLLTFNKSDFLRFPINVFAPTDILNGMIPTA